MNASRGASCGGQLLSVTVDGAIFDFQAHGGISRLFTNILPRMCDLEESLDIQLLVSGRPVGCPPSHRHIRGRQLPPIDRALRPTRLWGEWVWKSRACVQRVYLGKDNTGIWHSTYYTLPIHWRGPTVVSVMDMVHERLADVSPGLVNDGFRDRKRQAVMSADAVICISENTAKDVEEFYGIGRERMRVVRLACDDSFLRRTKGEERLLTLPPRPYFVYVGTRPPYKNFRGLLKAYGQWRGCSNVDLVVVGKPWSREETGVLRDAGIVDRVHLRVGVSDEELRALYSEARAFVYPSLYEGFGIPLLEAMACACPIIASRIPSTLEVAGDCPIYFEPSEVEGLVAAFDVALAEGRESDRVRRGIERAKRYSWDETARQTLQVYRALHAADRTWPGSST